MSPNFINESVPYDLLQGTCPISSLKNYNNQSQNSSMMFGTQNYGMKRVLS